MPPIGEHKDETISFKNCIKNAPNWADSNDLHIAVLHTAVMLAQAYHHLSSIQGGMYAEFTEDHVKHELEVIYSGIKDAASTFANGRDTDGTKLASNGSFFTTSSNR